MASVTIRPRDVTISFNTDCTHCCCWGTPIAETQPVYVTSKGALEKLDPKKGSEETAMKRSASHLKLKIRAAADSAERSASTVIKTIQDIAGVPLEEEAVVRPYTLGEIERVNAAARLVFSPMG